MRYISIFFILTFGLDSSTYTQTQGMQTAGAASPNSEDLKVQASCSKVNLGVSAAQITWSGPKAAASRGAGQSSIQVEVTTVKGGFDSGAAVVVWPNVARSREALSPSDHRLDPLRGLRVAPIAETKGARAPGDTGRNVTVENLSPGVNYFWRVQTKSDGTTMSSSVVKTTAPVCPVDYKRK